MASVSADRSPLGDLGLLTDVCGGIGSPDRGLWGHRVCRQMSVGASGLQMEVHWGHRNCRLRSVGTLSMETEVCRGMDYREILWEHLV